MFSYSAVAQNFADKDYYLVDSLEIDKVSESDKKMLDSCLAFFHQAKDDTTRLKGINTIVEESWDDNVWPKYNMWAYIFVQEKLKENPNEKVKRKLLLRLAGSINNIGYHESTKGNIVDALVFYKKGLKIQEEINSKEGMATSHNNIGTVYKKQGDVPTALEHYHKSLKLYQEIDNISGLGQALNNIGNTYHEQGDPNLALEYFHRGRNLYKKAGDERSEATILNNIGYSYFKKENISKALDYYNQSIDIRKKMNDIRGIATCYNNIASAYNYQGDIKQAMTYYLKSNKIYKELGYKLGLSTSSINVARVYYSQGDKNEAKKHAQLGLEIAEAVGSPTNIQSAAKLLSEIYGDENKGMKAFEMHKLYIVMRDSVKNQNNEKALIQQNAKYQYEKEKTIDDAERDKLIALKQKEKEKQTIISYGAVLGLLLAIGFAFFVFSRLKITRKQKLLIEAQKGEIVDSITYAKRIQKAILPTPELISKLLPDSFIYYKPKDIIAGDFYWVEKVGDKVFFAVADCTGHGVPGAMVSVVCNNALNSSLKEFGLQDPGEILDKTKEIVVEQFNKTSNTIPSLDNIRDGMDIALCVLNIKTNELQYSGAYNPLWLVRSGGAAIDEVKADRQPIGKIDKKKSFTTNTVKLQKSDTIYLFTDGFADQFGGVKGKKMMMKPFKKFLLSITNKTMPEQRTAIKSHFKSWKGNLEQVDDVCVMGVRFNLSPK
ncbi:MAG: tetratricopeptide repeat protein [Vicingaceae bacterium]|nr:tetratricopeptide repeat protein [Vicingaceae bacterium]